MSYILNTSADQKEMLHAIGAASIDELFAPIPPAYRMNRPLDVPAAMAEMELTTHFRELAGKNQSADDKSCFLGGGCYDHFIPAVVDAIAGRSEFYTAYTPYQ